MSVYIRLGGGDAPELTTWQMIEGLERAMNGLPATFSDCLNFYETLLESNDITGTQN